MTIASNFSDVSILCVGDVMIDRFVNGAVRRISPESPVPVLSISGSETFAGGAANVARNIGALGGNCTLLGAVGQDANGEELRRTVALIPTVEPVFVGVAGRPTTEKIRFVAHGQHMLRADVEDNSPIPAETEDKLLSEIESRILAHDVLVLSDYAKGTLTLRMVEGAVRIARAAGVPVIVDPKSHDFGRYNGATVITPNLQETLLATGINPSSDSAAVEAGEKILAQTTIEAVLITRAEKGMTLVRRSGAAPLHIASRARDVADVVGAGDTVIATLALAIGAGAPLEQSASLANTAAGLVVGKRGTATVTRSELAEEQELETHAGHLSPDVKVLSWQQAHERIRAWRADGLKIGFTNGCFDLLHVGHVSLLTFARTNCDRLVLGINTDASVKRLKGPTRPINTEHDRAIVLAALAVVDAVVLFDEDTPGELIEFLLPDVLVKGADYQISEIVGAATVLARGGQVLRFELVPGKSTTNMIQKAKQ